MRSAAVSNRQAWPRNRICILAGGGWHQVDEPGGQGGAIQSRKGDQFRGKDGGRRKVRSQSSVGRAIFVARGNLQAFLIGGPEGGAVVVGT